MRSCFGQRVFSFCAAEAPASPRKPDSNTEFQAGAKYMIQTRFPDQAIKLVEALKDPSKNLAVQEVIERWRGRSHTVKSGDDWRLEGFISFFQYFHELMSAVDPSFLTRLPPQCFDPDSIAKFFRLPDDAFENQKFEIENSGRSDDPPVTPEFLARITNALERLADGLTPMPAEIVGSAYIAQRLGCTQVWITEMARDGEIPQHCVVEGTGNGKPWKFHRKHIDRWLKNR
jgi:hypothetical protein